MTTTETEKAKIVQKATPSLGERGMTSKDIMERAKKVKYDEFYTRYEDIEKEISMYDKKIWKDKVVFCNCDDAIDETNGTINEKRTSAFALFFINNFKELGLKKLICTHYSGQVDLFHAGSKGLVYLITYELGKDGKMKIEKTYPKGYTGSFTDPLSLKILQEEADIVCTNPPFSRAIDYWKVVIESGKKFLIISNISNAINTAFIHYFKDNKVWAGYNRIDYFLNPKRQLVDASGHWYTNIPIKNRPKYKHLKMVPLKEIPEKYKKFDDSKTLLVDNCYIPNDYKKPFAVSARPILNGLLEKGYEIVQEKRYTPYVNGEERFARVLVQKK
ncbi:putative adenine-specific methylase [Planctomycetales bacterium]|nr:putative adenine-specific methylase [Planctomycetales bacterium]